MSNDVTNAPVPLTIQEKEYLCAALSDKQLQELTNWIKAKYVEGVVETSAYLASGLAGEMRNAAYKIAGTLTLDSEEGRSIFSTVKGAARVLYLMQLKATKDTYEHCLELVEATDEDEAVSIYTMFSELMAVEVKNRESQVEA